MDDSGFFYCPLGAKAFDAEAFEAFAAACRSLAPIVC
jgi:hypothetical protein